MDARQLIPESTQQADKVTQVALVDPNVLFRCGIARLLDTLPDFKVVIESNDVSEAIALARAQRPDVILLDVELAGVDAPSLTRRIARELPQVKIVLLSDQVDPDTLLGCVLAGAAGFLLKTITPEELFERLRGLRQGEAAMSLTTVAVLTHRLSLSRCTLCLRASADPLLTPREREVLVLVARGMTNRRIGELLQISEHTVRNHLCSIYHKLNLENRLQVAVYSVTHGLVDLGKGVREPG